MLMDMMTERALRIIVLLTVSLTPYVRCSGSQHMFADRIENYDDKELTQSPMWTLKGPSRIQCLAKCLNEKYCMSFQFNPSGPTCTAFRERFEGVTPPTVHQPGSSIFQTRKLLTIGFACYVDADCSPANSQCNQGRCTCDRGYDLDRDQCRLLTDCTHFNDVFTRYPNSMIISHDIAKWPDKTVPECLQICLDTPTCTTVDYDYTISMCFPQSTSWTEVTSQWAWVNYPVFDFYQRGCDW